MQRKAPTTYVVVVRRSGSTYEVTIPIGIVKTMEIKQGDELLVMWDRSNKSFIFYGRQELRDKWPTSFRIDDKELTIRTLYRPKQKRRRKKKATI